MIRLLVLLLFSVSAKSQVVYKTPSGAKYHLATCHTVKNVSQEITFAEARELRLLPCKVCQPADIYAKSLPVMGKAKGKVSYLF